MMKNDLLSEAAAIDGELLRHRRYLHKNAGIGFELELAKQYVGAELSSLGYSPVSCGRCGLYADVGSSDRAILLRADMDALPIREKTGLGFAAKNGNMHACGHDMHTAMLLGAAKILKAHESELSRFVRLIFEPAEEILEGACDMIGNGALSGLDFEGAMMIHVASGVELRAGSVILPAAGIGAPSADHFSVEVIGRGAHGGTPQLSSDAILTAAHLLSAFSELIARGVSINERALLTVGRFDGGNSPNAIAGRAVLRGTLRTFDGEVRARLKSRMVELSRGIATAFSCESDLIFEHGCPCLINSESAISRAKQCTEALRGENFVFSADALGAAAVGGSEDFAYFCERIPSVALSLCAGEPSRGFSYPLHHEKTAFDESVLPVGAALYAGFALEDSCL